MRMDSGLMQYSRYSMIYNLCLLIKQLQEAMSFLRN